MACNAGQSQQITGLTASLEHEGTVICGSGPSVKLRMHSEQLAENVRLHGSQVVVTAEAAAADAAVGWAVLSAVSSAVCSAVDSALGSTVGSALDSVVGSAVGLAVGSAVDSVVVGCDEWP